MDGSVGVSSGRRKVLKAIDAKDQLKAVQDPDGLGTLTDAVGEISLSGVRSPPTHLLEQINEVYSELPEEASGKFVNDEIFLQRINAARRQFNEWVAKRRRAAQIPSPVEAGRANYPTRRARKRSRSLRKADEMLEKKIDRIESAVNGARQRSLAGIGSSVSEQTEIARKQRRDEMRERLEAGAIVRFRNPNLRTGEVVRVNRKSIRVRYSNPRAGASCPVTGATEPEMTEDRIQLDSGFLEPLDIATLEAAEEALSGLDECRHSDE